MAIKTERERQTDRQTDMVKHTLAETCCLVVLMNDTNNCRCCGMKVMILKKGLDIHRSKVPESLQPFHAHMESRYREMKIVLDREYGIKVSCPLRDETEDEVDDMP